MTSYCFFLLSSRLLFFVVVDGDVVGKDFLQLEYDCCGCYCHYRNLNFVDDNVVDDDFDEEKTYCCYYYFQTSFVKYEQDFDEVRKENDMKYLEDCYYCWYYLMFEKVQIKRMEVGMMKMMKIVVVELMLQLLP